MRRAVKQLWPELEWIENEDLRESVTETWVKALERSPLEPDDLNHIPFTLLVPNCPATFMEHKRCVVHIAKPAALAMQEFLGKALKIVEPKSKVRAKIMAQWSDRLDQDDSSIDDIET